MHTPPLFEKKIISIEDLCKQRSTLATPLVFTNGVFDILHRGHVTYLAHAKALGAALIVAVNSDASVRKLNKGSDRPINRQEDRLALIASLHSVDWAVLFEEDTPYQIIEKIRPDLLVKGGDYDMNKLAETTLI